MRLSIIISTLFGATALCLPAVTSSATIVEIAATGDTAIIARHTTPGPLPPNDGRAATVWTKQYRSGGIIAQDVTGLPAMGCMGLNEIYGPFVDNVRSLIVHPGFRCKFHTEYQCGGKVLELGMKDRWVAMSVLGQEFDKHIRSVNCWTL